MIEKHRVTITTQATFHTLNQLTDTTQRIWIVCHGHGQLAEDFVLPFQFLDSKTNFVIALEGLSKFYLRGNQKVGASWMTKENRDMEIKNQTAYARTVLETLLGDRRIDQFEMVLLGFSQGASAIWRLAVHLQIPFSHLIHWAGSFPPELDYDDFDFLSRDAKVHGVLGDQDNYYDEEVFGLEINKIEKATGIKPVLFSYAGKHTVEQEALESLVLTF
ncbi:serine hydrolase family protein [Reichenbachiella agarivorans]|uniref:Serine hydrolase family protein n=1 Tax=Reichenbachiella agarivorans TaxID=2979464 RepID=A0ABY6CK84_9BACT|nr:serine hydrolase family protein [Reichenbachiella agarivorans]UXP30926.1 serine hydrolase family protein [Reichenbachiella agarivorans]